MAEQKTKKPDKPVGPDGEVCRDLICAEEWKDPATRKVLTEFHKDGLPKELVGVDADLESFERYWQKKGGSVKVKGEYHKDGAPFLDREPGWEDANKQEASGGETAEVSLSSEEIGEEAPKEPITGNAANSGGNGPTASEEPPPQSNVQRPIDMGLIEMVSYALFRVVFSQGLSIPIKREGMIDMDVTVEGKEITINTNQLFFSVPELNVWHVVYQHKGKPILELGRGVKNGMVIHRVQALRLGFEMWNGSRKMNKQKLRQAKEADRRTHLEAAK